MKSPVPRAVAVKTQKAYRLKSYGLFRQAGELMRRAYQDLIRGISTRRYEGESVAGAPLSRRMSKAYSIVSYEDARKELLGLARDLESINPSAARSLTEGLEETLTLHRLGLPDL